MARFRFRRRRFGRRRFYRRRRFGRKQRVINASSRSRCRVKVRAERFLEFQVVHGDYHGGVLCINPFIEQSQESQIVGAIPAPRYTSLIETKIFRYYSRLYEEFKLDYMKVNIMGITPVGATAQLEGITFTTAWDRRMIPAEFNTAGYPSPTDISDSPSSQQVTCINNSVIKFKRMIRPSDLLEKIAWYPVDTKYGSLPMKGVTTNATALSFYVDAGVYQPIPFCPEEEEAFDLAQKEHKRKSTLGSSKGNERPSNCILQKRRHIHRRTKTRVRKGTRETGCQKKGGETTRSSRAT